MIYSKGTFKLNQNVFSTTIKRYYFWVVQTFACLLSNSINNLVVIVQLFCAIQVSMVTYFRFFALKNIYISGCLGEWKGHEWMSFCVLYNLASIWVGDARLYYSGKCSNLNANSLKASLVLGAVTHILCVPQTRLLCCCVIWLADQWPHPQ